MDVVLCEETGEAETVVVKCERLGVNGMSRPLYQYLTVGFVAAGCKNRCRHCSASANTSAPELLTLEQMAGAMETLKAENAKRPRFWGKINLGLLYEPMDHPNIVDIQRLFYELNPEAPLVKTVATNGYRIATDPRYAKLVNDLHQYGAKRFQLTLHGLEQSHDWFAGRRGAYSDLLEAARRLSRCGAKINWIYFLNRRNMSECTEVIASARSASQETETEECISLWGPSGRGARQAQWRVKYADVEALPHDIREMRWLPEYRPEREWVEQALSGEMQRSLAAFYDHARAAGGIPDCSLWVDQDNLGQFAALLAEKRKEAQPEKEPTKHDEEDLAWLASTYGQDEDALYRVSTMKHEWTRRQREEG